MRDYYYILGIKGNDSEQQIKSAYRKLSLKFHPDKNDGDKFFEEKFKAIQEAYEVLSNKDKRNDYNDRLKRFKSSNHSDYENLKKQEEALRKKFDEALKKRQDELAQKEEELRKKQADQKKKEEEFQNKYKEASKEKEEEFRKKYNETENRFKQEYEQKVSQSNVNFENFKKYLESSKKHLLYFALIICLIIIIFFVKDKYASKNNSLANSNSEINSTSDPVPVKATPVDNYIYDNDGNKYNHVAIGNQTWMVGNIKTKTFNNGEKINNIENAKDWVKTNLPAYAYYNNEPGNLNSYGLLYNWFVINDPRGICPKGYHVPTLDDLNSFASYLKTNNIDIISIKARTLWKNAGQNKQNDSSLNIVPAGKRWFKDGKFAFINTGAYFWTSTEKDTSHAYFYALAFDSKEIGRLPFNKHDGFSCGCIKD